MKIGDVVGRKSYGKDVLFKIEGISEKGEVEISGIKNRIKVKSDIRDLENIKYGEIKEFRRKFESEVEESISRVKRDTAEVYKERNVAVGKVLHIDGDEEYLRMCMKHYRELEIPAVGARVEEKDQGRIIRVLLEKYMPDIVIVTGHDSLRDKKREKEIESYRSSGYYVEAVREARRVNPSKDSLVIIAGGCQSHYEGLIEAGANFASSPSRILIHAVDVVLMAAKIAYTSIEDVIRVDEIVGYTITGEEGIGGFETRGTLRKGNKKNFHKTVDKEVMT